MFVRKSEFRSVSMAQHRTVFLQYDNASTVQRLPFEQEDRTQWILMRQIDVYAGAIRVARLCFPTSPYFSVARTGVGAISKRLLIKAG